MKRPTLSMTMTNYNHAHYLPQAVQYILDQSYQPMELIIIDDASTDNSLEILEDFAQKYPIIRLIRNEQNMGIIHNLNRLLELASGDYVGGLACDDKHLPGYLEKSMKLLEQYPQAGLCSAASWIMDEEGNHTALASLPLINMDAGYITAQQSRYLLQHYGSWINGNVTIYKRQALLDAGGFIPELGSYTDGFIQEVLALRHGVCFIREPLGAWRFTTTGYAVTISTDCEKELAILTYAIELMNSRYREIFSASYIDFTTKIWLRRYSMLNWQKLMAEQRFFITNLTKRFELSGGRWFDHIIRITLKLLTLLQDITVKVLLGLRFGIPHNRLPAVIQKALRFYTTPKLKKMEG